MHTLALTLNLFHSDSDFEVMIKSKIKIRSKINY